MKKLFSILFAMAFMLCASQAMSQDNDKPAPIGEMIFGELVYGPVTDAPSPNVVPHAPTIKKELREIDLLLKYLSPNPNVSPDMIKDLVIKKMELEAKLPKPQFTGKKNISLVKGERKGPKMDNCPLAQPAPVFAHPQFMPPCGFDPQPPCPCFHQAPYPHNMGGPLK